MENDMDMQDNEFDKLFSSKLEGLEIEPSKQVWQGITREMDKNKRKRIALIPFLSIAASIIVLIAAGVLFIPQKNRLVKKPLVKNEIVKAHRPLHTSLIAKITIQMPVNKAVKASPVQINRVAVLHPSSKNKVVTPTQTIAVLNKSAEPVTTQNQPVLAAVAQKMDAIVPQAVDTINIQANVPVVKPTDKPILSAATLPAGNQPIMVTPIKKHTIKSFGDVLNVVIAAVDKRKDKFIEFSNTDGDEATITAVNIGIIKIKKED